MNMNEDPTSQDVTARLLRLRESASAIEPPAYVEARLLAQLYPDATRSAATAGEDAVVIRAARAHAGSAPPSGRHAPGESRIERWGAWIAWPVSMTVATGFLSWMVYTNPAVAPEPLPAMTSVEAAADDALAATPFVALASLDTISASSRNEVVTATLPRATLAEFGLPVSPLRAAETIDAEFLVGANGGVLAVRFVDSRER